MTMRQLPQAIDVETSLLGSMLIYRTAIETAVENSLAMDDFYVAANRKVYRAITQLYNENKPVDVKTLAARLNDLQDLNSIGGIDYLATLIEGAGSGANAAYYVQLIQEKARLRDLINVAENIATEGFDSQYAMDEVMDQAEKKLLEVTRRRKSTSFISAKEAVDETIGNIKKMVENHTPVVGMKTDFIALDRITNGFQKSDFIIIAARPSMGKTAFSLSLAMNMAECNNLPIAFFSLEMDAEALIRRLLQSKSGIDGNKIRSGYGISNKEMNSLIEAAEDLSSLPIYFNDNSQAVTVGNISSSCRKLQSEKGLGAVFIDYIQLMSGSNSRSDSRQQEVSEISRSLKQIARELQVPVIALSQLSRSAEQRTGNKRPMLSDLRESGALEQDADMVLFLYRDSYYEYTKQGDKEDNYERDQSVDENGVEEMEVIIAKHRNGATGTIKLAYNRAINAFYDYDYSTEEQ